MSLSINEILKTNSPSKRRVLEVGHNGVNLSKPNQLSIPDRYYTYEEIKQKGWKVEEKQSEMSYSSALENTVENFYKEYLEKRGYYVTKNAF